MVIHLAPGDPTELIGSEDPTHLQSLEQIRKLYGLDLPLHVQYWNWLKRIVFLDFGRSFQPDGRPVLDKIAEEILELRAELQGDRTPERVADEIGDVLFAVVNLARHLGIDAETALRRTNAKFERRFRSIEAALRTEGRRLEDASLGEMEALWQRAKAGE